MPMTPFLGRQGGGGPADVGRRRVPGAHLNR